MELIGGFAGETNNNQINKMVHYIDYKYIISIGVESTLH
jgi:hypothetical protein